MKRKIIFSSIAVVLVLFALYGIWHYSPLRHLTRSKSGSDQTQATGARGRKKPVIVAKKIRPEQPARQQPADRPRPLIVSKKIYPAETAQPVKPPQKIAAPTAAVKKTRQPGTEEILPAEASESPAVQPEKPLQPLPVQQQAVSGQKESLHPYSIMLSSCRLPQSARKVVSDYRKVGLKPYVVKVKFSGGEEWLRVLAGQYRTRREALEVKQKHRLSEAIVKRTPYTNLIGTYASQDEMQADLHRIKQLGYSPYFIETQSGRFKLLVGAFVTKEGAENYRAELKAKGIQNTVIIR